jgi:hypothetical protein
MDANSDGLVSFDDFLAGISRLAPNAVPELKMRCAWAGGRGAAADARTPRILAHPPPLPTPPTPHPTRRRHPRPPLPSAHVAAPPAVTFAIYDMDGTGRISPANLRALLASVLAEHDVALPGAQLDALVAHTFATEDANRDGCVLLRAAGRACARGARARAREPRGGGHCTAAPCAPAPRLTRCTPRPPARPGRPARVPAPAARPLACSVIDFSEFASMVARNPSLLKSLTLSVSELISL